MASLARRGEASPQQSGDPAGATSRPRLLVLGDMGLSPPGPQGAARRGARDGRAPADGAHAAQAEEAQ
eukprot:12065116-Prorocentrum_lima.AAC.1